MPDYTLNELLNLPANAARYAALQALVEHVSQNQTDIATNGWDGSANPNSFDSHRYVLTTGSGTAYVATFSPTFGSLQDGTMLKVDFHTASGDSPTLNLDSLGAKALIKPDTTAISSNEIIAGVVLPCVYSAGLDKWVVIGLSPSSTWLTNALFNGF